MRRKINLLAMLFVCGGAAGLMAPAEASATYKAEPDEDPKAYCCYHQWTQYKCCGENGCRITPTACTKW
jgi:hypothetical protein